MERSGAGSEQLITGPDPGGPKIYGYHGSKSGTLNSKHSKTKPYMYILWLSLALYMQCTVDFYIFFSNTLSGVSVSRDPGFSSERGRHPVH
jgi:hypothetical protein